MSSQGSNQIIGAFGVKGHGKTYYGVNRVRDFPRFLIFDTCRQLNPHEEQIPWAGTAKAAGGHMLRQKNALHFGMIFQPSYNQDIRFQQMEWICRVAANVGQCCILIDEIDRFTGPNFTPEYLGQIIEYGRLVSVSLIYTARRFASVSRNLTAQTDEMALFRNDEPIDIDEVRRRIPGAAEIVPTLPKHEAVIWRRGENGLTRWPTPVPSLQLPCREANRESPCESDPVPTKTP